MAILIPRSKVERIKTLLATPAPVRAIAHEVGVCETAVYRINRLHKIRKIRPKRSAGNLAKGIPGLLLSELAKQYSVAELVEKLDFSQTTIVRWRSGRGNLSFFQVQILADLAGYELQLVKKESRS